MTLGTRFTRAGAAAGLLAGLLVAVLVTAGFRVEGLPTSRIPSDVAEAPAPSSRTEPAVLEHKGPPKPARAHRKELPAAFTQAAPTSLADLKAIEEHVKKLVARVSPAVVAVEVGEGSGSGVVITADGLVLTAGHVSERADREVRFTFPNGKTARGRTLGSEHDTDTGLLRINDPGPWPCVTMGDLVEDVPGDWVLALGHPGGFDSKRSLVVRLGRIIRLSSDALQTDCPLQPGDSGGPLFDMHGCVIGIHSAISRSLAENFHVPISAFYDSWAELENGGSGREATTATEPRDFSRGPGLPRARYRSGDQTLRAFAPVSELTRRSIVKFNVNGETVALGTVMDGDGLVLTKASELKRGKLTCWLAVDKEVEARVLGIDETEDLALVRVDSQELRPILWSDGDVAEGQWAITPGIAPTPHAVGIISASSRRIRPQRAFIGVWFDFSVSTPKVGELLPGFGAEKAGVKPGDIIVAVNQTTVTNRDQIMDLLREFPAGQIVKLRLKRATEPVDVAIEMMSPTDNPSEASSARTRRFTRLGGEISRRAEGFERAIEHDTVLVPWLCGGPLVNLDGKALGLNIARASRVTTFALPPKLVRRVFDELKSRFGRSTAL